MKIMKCMENILKWKLKSSLPLRKGWRIEGLKD